MPGIKKEFLSFVEFKEINCARVHIGYDNEVLSNVLLLKKALTFQLLLLFFFLLSVCGRSNSYQGRPNSLSGPGLFIIVAL